MPISQLRVPVKLNLKKALPVYRNILKSCRVTEPIITEETSNVVVKGFRVLHALQLLSVEKAPVIMVDLSEIKVKPITVRDLLKAAFTGPKLEEEEFEIEVARKIPEISIELEQLTAKRDHDRRVLKVFNSTLELLYMGWPTPLVKLNTLSSSSRQVWAKLEGYNPFSNSVKDRIGWSMVMKAIEEGNLSEMLYEATSTNTGIALAALANILGLKAKLFIPKTIQRASDILLKVLGAEVVRLPVSLTVEAIEHVEKLSKEHGAVNLNQFENDANLEVHLKYTAKELDEQLSLLNLKPTCIIGGIGTSGHMSAISIYFKSKYGRDVKIVGVQPAPNETIPGIRRRETGMKWIEWAETEFDEIIDVKLEEAIEGALSIARTEGLLIGLSAGAVVHAFKCLLERGEADSGVHILVFPDTGYKYVEQFESYFKLKEEKRVEKLVGGE